MNGSVVVTVATPATPLSSRPFGRRDSRGWKRGRSTAGTVLIRVAGVSRRVSLRPAFDPLADSMVPVRSLAVAA